VLVAEGDRAIKVQDFRMFTPDGELRPEYRDLESSAQTVPPEKPAPENPEAPAPAQTAAPPPLSALPEPQSSAPESPEEESDFTDLVRQLATSAYAALGLLAEPGAKRGVDLPGARRMIDWLTALELKTRNNLSFAEQNLLSGLLYEIRLAFVEAEAAARAARR
jgi:Domain of unknown function (DUF1844)